MRDRLIRRNITCYMGGKLPGMALVLSLIWFVLPAVVHAASRGTIATPTINAVNTVWTLIAAFLVFCMQVGFVMLEAGFARSRESVNILVVGFHMKSLMDQIFNKMKSYLTLKQSICIL